MYTLKLISIFLTDTRLLFLAVYMDTHCNFLIRLSISCIKLQAPVQQIIIIDIE